MTMEMSSLEVIFAQIQRQATLRVFYYLPLLGGGKLCCFGKEYPCAKQGFVLNFNYERCALFRAYIS